MVVAWLHGIVPASCAAGRIVVRNRFVAGPTRLALEYGHGHARFPCPGSRWPGTAGRRASVAGYCGAGPSAGATARPRRR